MEKMTRENAKPIKKYWHTLDNCIDTLLEYQKNNEESLMKLIISQCNETYV